eukprot:18200-Amphidinium_carterae.1
MKYFQLETTFSVKRREMHVMISLELQIGNSSLLRILESKLWTSDSLSAPNIVACSCHEAASACAVSHGNLYAQGG